MSSGRSLRLLVLGGALTSCAVAGSGPGEVYDACGPGKIDQACYAAKRDPTSSSVALATQIAASYIERHPADQLAWDWGPGVLMFSLVELHRVTGDRRFHDYYEAWLDAQIKRGYAIQWSDSCPPALTALALLEETGKSVYRKVVDDVLAYYRSAPRTEEGGLSHLGNVIPQVKTMWLDSLFMVGMVVSRWGELADDRQTLDSIGEQFRVFTALMQREQGLFVHAHDWPGQEDDVFWARGNAWVTVSAHEYLRILRLRGEIDERVAAALERQVSAVVGLQDSGGLWWTVVNHPGQTYLETSASALFAYGLARGFRYGLRRADVLPVIARAVSGIVQKVSAGPDGRAVVRGISCPTMVGDFAYYASVKLEDDLHFGVGAVILALVEASGLPPTAVSAR